jgi:hypothetical protein
VSLLSRPSLRAPWRGTPLPIGPRRRGPRVRHRARRAIQERPHADRLVDGSRDDAARRSGGAAGATRQLRVVDDAASMQAQARSREAPQAQPDILSRRIVGLRFATPDLRHCGPSPRGGQFLDSAKLPPGPDQGRVRYRSPPKTERTQHNVSHQRSEGTRRCFAPLAPAGGGTGRTREDVLNQWSEVPTAPKDGAEASAGPSRRRLPRV